MVQVDAWHCGDLSMSQQDPESPSIEKLREDILRRSAAEAEATVYSLSNSYLTANQKSLVEAVYQLPAGVFGYVLLGYLAFIEPRSYITAFLFAAICNAAVSIPWWFVANTNLAMMGLAFAGYAAQVIHLGFAIYFGYQGAWLSTGIAVASMFGLLAFITPSLWIYTYLGRGMNPKYRIAKKPFGMTFPFEKDLAE